MRLLAIVAAVLCASMAQADPHPLPVSASATWKHGPTGLAFAPQLGGLTRNSVGDYGTEGADLVLDYFEPSANLTGTLYLFHPGVDSVPLWFDRVQAQIEARKSTYGTTGEATPVAFAGHAGGPTSALRVTYPMTLGKLTSTAVAVVPAGEWLLVVRLSSGTLDAAALDTRLSAILADIRWPSRRDDTPPAVLVRPCTTGLAFHKATVLPSDPSQMLFNALGPAVAHDDPTKAAPPAYCRDMAGPDGNWAVYRADGSDNAYVLALLDAGSAIGVVPALDMGGPKSWAVTLLGLTQAKIYPNVSDLLPPEQALEMIDTVKPIATTSTLGKKRNINIAADVLDKTK